MADRSVSIPYYVALSDAAVSGAEADYDPLRRDIRFTGTHLERSVLSVWGTADLQRALSGATPVRWPFTVYRVRPEG